ncbi:MAG: hypothetical protein B7Y05_20465 [Polynucleobacter sp. 24-46-87]|nr:MAG: hypothetical protein B7Y05_20465 [Polynucleobacter sp. 24-46-87]
MVFPEILPCEPEDPVETSPTDPPSDEELDDPVERSPTLELDGPVMTSPMLELDGPVMTSPTVETELLKGLVVIAPPVVIADVSILI